MKKLFVVSFLCLLFAEIINAQGYTPQVGDTILFYPLSKKAKTLAMGYDCFYDATKIKKKSRKILEDDYYVSQSAKSNISYKFKDTYRYKCAENGLTPFDEIEGHTFRVSKMERYTYKNKKENEAFLLFLTRLNDSSKLILRVPFYDDKVNFLTKKFICEKEEGIYPQKRYLYVNLPCLSVNYMDSIRNVFVGKELFYKEKHISDINSRIAIANDFKSISKAINNEVLSETYFDVFSLNKCKDVRFEKCSISDFDHPFAICTYCFMGGKEVEVKIPLVYIAGNSSYFNKGKWSNYLFDNLFTTKEKELPLIFEKEGCVDIVEKFSGKEVYYGLKEKYRYDGREALSSRYNAEKNIQINNGRNYVILEGLYKCIKFDVIRSHISSDDVFAFLEDSLGFQFRVPATSLFSGTSEQRKISYYYKDHLCEDFQEYFLLKDEAIALMRERQLLAIKKEKEEKERFQSWVKKYGSTYANYIKDLNQSELEKFEKMASKYGKSTAKMMVERKVRIGWSKQMCIDSWGHPDDINRTIGSWGVHEQWVYGEIYCSYLYFEDGVLTSIQN
ncbi:MAG: hypothetical protein IJB28_07415 [Bacteroidaceae bacterium]|nr:hypothetical protein [Bacteroidaceae bacterium]